LALRYLCGPQNYKTCEVSQHFVAYKITFSAMNRLETLQNMHAQMPTDSFVLYALATEYGKVGDWENCIHYFQVLEGVQPNYVGLYYHLGKAFEKTNDIEKAVYAYKNGISVARAVGDAHALSELQGALIQWEDPD
jgi:predicted Zn-dependent protease